MCRPISQEDVIIIFKKSDLYHITFQSSIYHTYKLLIIGLDSELNNLVFLYIHYSYIDLNFVFLQGIEY